jgi:hypothetical protein
LTVYNQNGVDPPALAPPEATTNQYNASPFFGRDDMLADVVDVIIHYTRPIAILGRPGIGKATLGRQALQSKSARDRFTKTMEVRDLSSGMSSTRLVDCRFFVSCVGITTLDQFLVAVPIEKQRLAMLSPIAAFISRHRRPEPALLVQIESIYLDPFREPLPDAFEPTFLADIDNIISLANKRRPQSGSAQCSGWLANIRCG